MAEYPISTLGQLAADETGSIAIGPFGSRMKADLYVSEGVPVIRGTNIGRDRALKGEWVFVSEEFANGIGNCIVNPGDLVFPHRGSIGEVALIEKHHGRMVLSSSMMKFRPNPRRARSAFLYYFFRSAAGRSEIMRFGSQVGTPGIGQPLTSLRQFRVPMPPLGMQDAIANLLGTLDDKIELNRRMNETLEAMAHAIFRDWFVDFGPTRRKINGATNAIEIMGGLVTDPERARQLADLFPVGIDDNRLPQGWKQHGLDQIADFLNGLALQKYPSDDSRDSLPVIKIAELRSGVTSKSNRAARTVPAKYIVRDGDFLFSWSGSLLAKFWTEGDGALNQHLFKVSSDHYPSWFYSLWV